MIVKYCKLEGDDMRRQFRSKLKPHKFPQYFLRKNGALEDRAVRCQVSLLLRNQSKNNSYYNNRLATVFGVDLPIAKVQSRH